MSRGAHSLRVPTSKSIYSTPYVTKSEVLYHEEGDGEVFVAQHPYSRQRLLVSCIDISTMSLERREQAIALAQYLSSLQHPHLF